MNIRLMCSVYFSRFVQHFRIAVHSLIIRHVHNAVGSDASSFPLHLQPQPRSWSALSPATLWSTNTMGSPTARLGDSHRITALHQTPAPQADRSLPIPT